MSTTSPGPACASSTGKAAMPRAGARSLRWPPRSRAAARTQARRMNARLGYTGAALAALSAIVIAFLCGRFPVSLADLAAIATGQPVHADVRAVVVELRAPRILAALLVGGGLAAAGSAY